MNVNGERNDPLNKSKGLISFCAACCQRLVARLQVARNAVLTEFRQSFNLPERMLRLVVNEAEALAWETEFPLLVFPTLAQEKAQALVDWNQHQQALLGAQRAPAGLRYALARR